MLTLPRPIVLVVREPRLRFGRPSGTPRRGADRPGRFARPQAHHDSQQVLAHLTDVAAAGQPVTIDTGDGELITGRLGFPQIDSMVLPFWLTDGGPLPDLERGIAHLRYHNADSPFQFDTSIRSRWRGLLWQLHIPATLDARAVRLARRHPLAGWFLDYRDSARAAGCCRIDDLSTTGVSIVAREDDMLPRVGETLTGTLVGPMHQRVPVRATVRRSAPHRLGWVRFGCSFQQIGFQNLVRVANIVRLAPRGLVRSAG